MKLRHLIARLIDLEEEHGDDDVLMLGDDGRVTRVSDVSMYGGDSSPATIWLEP